VVRYDNGDGKYRGEITSAGRMKLVFNGAGRSQAVLLSVRVGRLLALPVAFSRLIGPRGQLSFPPFRNHLPSVQVMVFV
jgi:hypothetical protein